MSKGAASVFGRFDALYAGALSGGSGRGTEYAVLGQYGNPCTSWQEKDAAIRPIRTDKLTSAHKPNRKETTQTRLGSKVYRPTEPRAVPDRIDSIIREGLQTANEPLLTPSIIVAKPHLLRKYLRALGSNSIAFHACANGACRLRERGEPGVECSEYEGKVGL